MTKRIAAIALIFICTTLAWFILGATIFTRTHDLDGILHERVGATWGTKQSQQAPEAYTERIISTPSSEPGPSHASPPLRPNEPRIVRDNAALERSRIAVNLDLEHRQKGLLWYSTYAVDFRGDYTFRNNTTKDSVRLELRLPTSNAIYDDLQILVNGEPAQHEARRQMLVTTARVPVGDTVTLAVGYRSQGLDEWRYVPGEDVARVRDFELVMKTNFEAIDFPANTLSPTEKTRTPAGWELRWQYSNLLSGFQIGMDMPAKLQPGPLAARIAFFAPVSLLFFFAAIFMITTVRGIEVHPMNYAFLAAAFFAFHLLLAYLVDHMSIHLAFAISSAVSVALVVTYMRLVVGPQFALREAAVAQVLYLVLFSYAFFLKGYTGLAITIGSVITLFVAMQLTGRIRWSDVFQGRLPAHPAGIQVRS